MRRSLVIAGAVAGTASAQFTQAAAALTFWAPGPAMNPSLYSKQGLGLTTYPPVASILSSDAATTIFALGCPSSVPATQSRIPDGSTFLTCDWATDSATYTLINGTRNVMHVTRTSPEYSHWWTCDYNTVATQVTCALDVVGDDMDTNEPVSDWVIPDRNGNVIAFATAEIVTEGYFAELACGVSSSALPCNSDGTAGKPTSGASGSAATGLVTESGSAPSPTASASVATASTGTAAKYGVEGVALAVLAGVAALNI